MDAVGTIELTMFVAVVEVHGVVLHVALDVWLLDAPSRRRIVMGDGEPHHRTVGEIDGALHKALAKRTATHHKTTVLVLNGSCNDFCSRGRELIDKHHYLAVA